MKAPIKSTFMTIMLRLVDTAIELVNSTTVPIY